MPQGGDGAPLDGVGALQGGEGIPWMEQGPQVGRGCPWGTALDSEGTPLDRGDSLGGEGPLDGEVVLP